ncbi:AcvB/VirJ family lysyl-phosphatidylglycerol hydrolase [Hydrogenophaga sp. PBL-H3]|uniref:AcvB/VirJ family lysyl-phosphatidylglycerol hydrolase n=1 Tax=Hydrogenophaga sp. PBL-H3 TaxID=434010 RepID=UPI00131F827C|nr:AcvB/VirJ family lysyl-phosphatidylglycerol hydrolase [Hydrogenophaga sp. PBL-H3]QHE74649.1 virulence factor family protein [Hydrogenophaga sp. PBL-H3]QHE79074.1 virulence factor family protein [Hydrogenophaga sp. PBL-H3]
MNLIATSLLSAALALGAAAPAHAQEKISHGNFKDVSLVRPKGEAKSFVLFLSGDAGWTPALAAQAQALAEQGAAVAGIHTPNMLARIGKDSGDCLLPDGDLENLSHFLQGYARLPAYFPPLLVGPGLGGTLAYAMLAQAPEDTFAGAISMGFCPELALKKPLCKGEGVHFTQRTRGAPLALLPTTKLRAPWVALQGSEDKLCSPAAAQKFVAQVGGAELVQVPGADHAGATGPGALNALLAAHQKLTKDLVVAPVAPESGVADLPLVLVPSTVPSDTLAVLLSGDGGWAGIDKQLAAKLAAAGMPVVGLDSLRYFWSARTPDGLAQDLDRVMRTFAVQWKKSRVVLIGYSQGADVLPFAVNRLPATSSTLLAHTVLIGPGEKASFEFRLTNWVSKNTAGLLLMPELQKMTAAKTLCIYGTDDRETLCPHVSTEFVTPVPMAGGHHFDGVYQKLTDQILQRTKAP